MRQRAQESARAFGQVFAVLLPGFIVVVAVVGLLAQLGLPHRADGILIGSTTLAALVLIAFLGRTMRRTDFQFGGRNVPAIHNGTAMAGAFLGGIGFVGLAGSFFSAGSGALALVLGAIGGFTLLTVLVAPYFRSSGAATVPDLLAARFGGGVMRLVAPLLVIACSFGLLVTEFAIAGQVAAAIFGITSDLAVGLVVVVVILSTLSGGMRSLVLAGTSQYAVVAVAFLAPLVLFSTQEFGLPLPQGALGVALHRLADFPAAAAARLSAVAMDTRLLPAFGFEGLNFVLIVVTFAAGIAALPHIVMRSAATVDVDGARRSGAWAFLFVMIVVTAAPAYSVFASLGILDSTRAASPTILPGWVYALGAAGDAKVCGVPAVSPEAIADACNRIGVQGHLEPENVSIAGDALVLAFPSIARLPPILTALLAVGCLAAALAAAGALLFTVASTLGHDFYPRLFDPHAPGGRRLIVMRLMVIAVALYGGWLAARHPSSLLPVAAGSISIAASGLFPGLVLGIWWRRCTSLGAVSGMLAGAGIALFYLAIVEFAGERPWSFFGFAGTAVPGFAAGAFGLPIGLFVTILVSLATPAERDRYQAIDALRRPNAAAAAEEDD
jgi:cation/acetate symporter